MKLLGIWIAALALAGCTSNSSHTLAVEGDPAAVARFVDSEEARPGEVSVVYQVGERRAQFSLPTEAAQTEMRLRASAANLAATETRSVEWSIGGIGNGSSTTTTQDPASSPRQGS